MKRGLFRVYVTDKWFEHRDEIFEWTGRFPQYDEQYYFNQHKWLLRAMYKAEKNLK